MASPPDNRIALSWETEFAAYKPERECAAWSVATFKAPFYEPTSRAPIDVCAVIDKSGSMAGEKLNLVKETLEFVIDQRTLSCWICKLATPTRLSQFPFSALSSQ